MGLFKKTPAVDPLVLYPVRAHPFEVDEEGNVVILLPRYGEGLLGRLYTRFLGRPSVRLPLDARGSCFWHLCDGTRNFENVCILLEEQFGAEVAPAKDRALVMLRTLMHQGCLKVLKEALAEPAAGITVGDEGA